MIYMNANSWLQKGREFLEEAEHAFSRNRHWFVCFNAHQAAEFFLKGKLLEKCGSFSFTHDLAVLLRELCACVDIDVPKDVLLAAQFLTPHYIESRYPGTKGISYDKSLSSNCLEMAKKIIEWSDKL